jgi:tetratricopeptide (TPR) repeat protein
VARTLSGLGAVALAQVDFEAAERLGEEAYGLYRELGQKRGMALSRHNQGFAARCRGELDLAQSRYEEALALLREVGDQDHIALSQGDLAVTLVRRGDLAAARAKLTEALTLARELESKRASLDLLDGCAELALAGGDPATALRFSAAGGHIRSTLGLSLSPFEEQEHSRFNSSIRESLRPEEVATVISEAQGPNFENMTAEALAWLEGNPSV